MERKEEESNGSAPQEGAKGQSSRAVGFQREKLPCVTVKVKEKNLDRFLSRDNLPEQVRIYREKEQNNGVVSLMIFSKYSWTVKKIKNKGFAEKVEEPEYKNLPLRMEEIKREEVKFGGDDLGCAIPK